MSADQKARRWPIRLWHAAALATVAVCLCYSNHFGNSFHFDDSHAVIQNPYIRSLSNIPKFFTDATTFSTLPANRTWRPLVSTSLAIDYWLGGGLKPLWFHVSTFIWYLTQLAAMYFLFRRILRSADDASWVDYCALFAAAWYGLHPAMAETVNYVIQRGDVYSTLGVVASLAIFALAPGARRFGLYLLPAALTILAKPPAAIFPAILLTYILLFEESPDRRGAVSAFRQSAMAWILTVALMLLQVRMTPRSYLPGTIPAHDYLITQPFVVLRYCVSFFLPLRLSADTDLNALSTVASVNAIEGLLFVGFVAWCIWWTAQRRITRPICFGLAWFLLTLLPTALFPLAEVENDHRMFMPFVGLVLAVTWTVSLGIRSHLRVRPALVAAAAMLILTVYGQGAWHRNRVWATEATLWKDATEKSPKNGRGLMNYGLTLMSSGRTAEALTYFEKAAQYTPNYYILEINTAIARGALGHDAEAESHFLRAHALAPSDALPDYFYGRWLHQKNRDEAAAETLRAAIAKNPDYLDSRYELMRVYAESGMAGDLRALAVATVQRTPGDPVANRFLNMQARPRPIQANAATNPRGQSPEDLLNLSLAYNRAGKFRESIRAAQAALSLRPNFAEAWNNLAAVYESLEDWDNAIRAARTAIALKPDFQLAKNNLAWSIQQKHSAQKVVQVSTH